MIQPHIQDFGGDNFIQSIFTRDNFVARIIQVLWQNRDTGVYESALLEEYGISEGGVRKCLYWNVIRQEDGLVRLDGRIEEYLEEVLTGREQVNGRKYLEVLDNVSKLVSEYNKAKESATRTHLLAEIKKDLRKIWGLLENGTGKLRETVELKYRTSPNSELKILNLNDYDSKCREILEGVDKWNEFLKTSNFFFEVVDSDVLRFYNSFGQLSDRLKGGLLGIMRIIQNYLNKAVNDYERAQKLLTLNSLLEREEYAKVTNIAEVAENCIGPWFSDKPRIGGVVNLQEVDEDIVRDVFERMDVKQKKVKERKIPSSVAFEEVLEAADWDIIRENFQRQEKDLFRYLLQDVMVEGRRLKDEELATGFITIIQREPLLWKKSQEVAIINGWEFTIIEPTKINE